MTHLLDTDICIYWLKGAQPILEHVNMLGLNRLAISAITAAELYFGAHNSARVAENLFRAEAFVHQMTVLPLGDSILKIFGRIKAELRKQGQPLADFDLLIASTALSEGRVLVTNNIQHYARIPGLQLENWSTP
jgi:tRNA(fMet)-specific endonuclease VapC